MRIPAKIALVLIAGTGTLVSGVLLAELGLRGVYAYVRSHTERQPLLYERVYWRAPPWVRYGSVVRYDPESGWQMEPDARRTYINLYGPIGDLEDVDRMLGDLWPSVPAWAAHRDSWVLETNALGLRDRTEPAPKRPGSIRVVALGDSWTVGVNVADTEAYPAVLERILNDVAADGPSAPTFEVINHGAIGAGIDSGRRVLPRALELAPDVVILAYAQNDEAQTRLGRSVASGAFRPRRLSRRLLAASELWRLWQWWSRPPGDDPSDVIRRQMVTRSGASLPCPPFDPLRAPYGAALSRVVQQLQSTGTQVVLLYANVPEFLSHCTRVAMAAVARTHHVPMVDAAAILEQAEHELASELVRQHHLSPSGSPTGESDGDIEVVFRVDAADTPGPIYVMGNGPELADFTPNAMPLYDDASHGDEIAGDGVWSRAVSFPGPRRGNYAYTNGSEAGRWRGLESYRSRTFETPANRPGEFRPIDRFGKPSLRSDPSHPDAEGHRRIAAALAEVLRGMALDPPHDARSS